MLSKQADLAYRCTDYYRPDDDFGILWNDGDIDVQWPIETPLLSDKDKRLPTLAEAAKDDCLPVYRK